MTLLLDSILFVIMYDYCLKILLQVFVMCHELIALYFMFMSLFVTKLQLFYYFKIYLQQYWILRFNSANLPHLNFYLVFLSPPRLNVWLSRLGFLYFICALLTLLYFIILMLCLLTLEFSCFLWLLCCYFYLCFFHSPLVMIHDFLCDFILGFLGSTLKFIELQCIGVATYFLFLSLSKLKMMCVL